MELEGRKKKAKALKDAGQYPAAAEEYRRAIDQSKELDRLEDEESVEYDYEAEALMEELREVEARQGSRDEVADEGGEQDLVSAGIWLWMLRRDPDGAEDRGGAVEIIAGGEAPAPWGVGPLIEVPAIGYTVRYQHLLLEAGERRTVVVDAKRRRGR